MDVAIVGLPRSGKTTVFNAVTRGHAEVAAYSDRPNVGVAKVADPRLDMLAGVYQPKRVVPAEVRYIDLPSPPEGLGTTRGVSGEYLNLMQSADALLLVVRAFTDPAVAAVDDLIDPLGDAQTMLLELAFSDVEIVERRLGRIDEGSKGARAAERVNLDREREILRSVKEGLEAETAVRHQALTADDRRSLEGFQLLTAKPTVVVANIGEDQLHDAAGLESELQDGLAGAGVRAAALCGEVEMGLAAMDADDEREMREGMGLGESGLDRMIRLSQDAADLITFFTGNANEVRAWTVPEGATAVEAAGRVHTDFAKGFIRAEVMGAEALATLGGPANARRQGVLSQEGKSYTVRDGDVLNILFNV